MSATGLEVFDRTLQITNIWLDEMMDVIGPDRKAAWHVLGAVLRTVRDRLPAELAAHLGAQLPLLVRGTYYDRFRANRAPLALDTADEFLAHVSQDFAGSWPVDVRLATSAVFAVMDRHMTSGITDKVRQSLPSDVRRMWVEPSSFIDELG